MYINEHIFVYKRTYFMLNGTKIWSCVIKLLKIRLYNWPRVAYRVQTHANNAAWVSGDEVPRS